MGNTTVADMVPLLIAGRWQVSKSDRTGPVHNRSGRFKRRLDGGWGLAMRTIIVTAFVGALALCTAIRADDQSTEKDAKMLEGKWQLVEGTVDGQSLPPEFTKGFTLTLSHGKYLAKFVVLAEGKHEGTVKYIPDTAPKAMEITWTAEPNKGKTCPAIYELKGDTLTVCYALSGNARPTKFESKYGTRLFLATYRKAKS
jgi:uncharacterized protein (TIGR03067 family)